MFGNFKKNTILGLDVGHRAIKAVKATHREGEFPRVEAISMHAYDPGQANLFQELHGFLASHKFLGLPTAASLDDASLKIRKIELPKMQEADLKEAIRWGMRDVVEGNINEYTVRHSSLESTGDNKRQAYVGYAMKKKVVRDFQLFLQKAGAKCLFVEPMAVTQSAILEALIPSDDFLAAINIGATHTLMTLVGHGKLYFSRPLPQIAYSPTPAANFNSRLAAEIQNTLDSFAVTFRVENVKQLLLMGAASEIEGLEGYLSTNLGIPTSLLDPFQNLSVPEPLLKAVGPGKGVFALAAGLCRIPKLEQTK